MRFVSEYSNVPYLFIHKYDLLFTERVPTFKYNRWDSQWEHPLQSIKCASHLLPKCEDMELSKYYMRVGGSMQVPVGFIKYVIAFSLKLRTHVTLIQP